MISYAKYKSIYGFWKVLLDNSTKFQKLHKASIGMEKKILENSVIILEKYCYQINTMFTITYLPSISPISGSTETW